MIDSLSGILDVQSTPGIEQNVYLEAQTSMTNFASGVISLYEAAGLKRDAAGVSPP